MKQEVLFNLIPEYVKTMYGVHNLEGCEQPTTTLIEKLAELLLPGKKVKFLELVDQKSNPEE